mmetsp:Transcript_17824/g.60813  ORF Transcript_17824/g.60813 Transcript_17824/m.60813 type:complete len:500 (-) Transcript_17824:1643-3142(-)|eukprot:CAMPEP_0183793712 /NCGR_PEP_ID=MMETSP0803_2-20130417/3383_1 /TAXON_ID=195967 /ORGANISM="Crustomastix stigmata, Strain CCMP3273" /LENGTH=499 /DNA_ID=CAMNT_0026038099 /DNA_START=138 /DNA_END=1637 /DNA_ORIENTATION=+
MSASLGSQVVKCFGRRAEAFHGNLPEIDENEYWNALNELFLLVELIWEDVRHSGLRHPPQLSNNVLKRVCQDGNSVIARFLLESFSEQLPNDAFRIPHVRLFKGDSSDVSYEVFKRSFSTRGISSFAEYKDALMSRCPNEDFAVVINLAEFYSTYIRQTMHNVLQDVFAEIGVPRSGATTVMWFGSYLRTPFGVHQDGPGLHTLTYCLTDKSFKVWPRDEMWSPTVPGHYRSELNRSEINFEQECKASYEIHAQQGDWIYIPNQYYHVGVSKERHFVATCIAILSFNNFEVDFKKGKFKMPMPTLSSTLVLRQPRIECQSNVPCIPKEIKRTIDKEDNQEQIKEALIEELAFVSIFYFRLCNQLLRALCSKQKAAHLYIQQLQITTPVCMLLNKGWEYIIQKRVVCAYVEPHILEEEDLVFVLLVKNILSSTSDSFVCIQELLECAKDHICIGKAIEIINVLASCGYLGVKGERFQEGWNIHDKQAFDYAKCKMISAEN